MPDDRRSPWIVDIAIEPKGVPRRDQGSFLDQLNRLVSEDRDLQAHVDEESGQTILSGRDEAHLEVAVERLRTEISINVGAPQVAYRETITKSVESDYTHEGRQAAGELARIKFRIEPREDDDFAFRSLVPAGMMPADHIAAVRRAIETVAQAGPVIGFPIIRLRYTLLDGAHQAGNSSLAILEKAARIGFQRALERAAPKILEPIMQLNVVVPELYVGAVTDDLNKRRGHIRGAQTQGFAQAIEGVVPLAGMFGYANSLHTMSHGTGQYAMTFSHYEQVPSGVDPDDRFPPAMAMRA
jgi:elongation factor G